MKFLEIRSKLSLQPIFSPKDILDFNPNFRLATLYDWEKRGLVNKIRNNWYFFSDKDLTDFNLYFVANKIYSPSYISIEMALNHYGFIPEATKVITSVSPKKTTTFETPLGSFEYKSLKSSMFFGYEIFNNENVGVKIANPEKAILDFLYLNPQIVDLEDIQGMRFNPQILNEKINTERLNHYLNTIDSPTLTQKANLFFKYINTK